MPPALMATVVIAMSILRQALLAKHFISLLKRLDWVQPASVPSTMMRCTVISTWYPTRGRSSTILRSVTRSPIRASQHSMSHKESHVRRQHEVSPLLDQVFSRTSSFNENPPTGVKLNLDLPYISRRTCREDAPEIGRASC